MGRHCSLCCLLPLPLQGSERCWPAGAKALGERERPSHSFCAFAAASASSNSCVVMRLLSGSFSASVRWSHPLQLLLRGFMSATKCGCCSLKCWQAGQQYGMVPADGVLVNSLEGSLFEDA